MVCTRDRPYPGSSDANAKHDRLLCVCGKPTSPSGLRLPRARSPLRGSIQVHVETAENMTTIENRTKIDFRRTRCRQARDPAATSRTEARTPAATSRNEARAPAPTSRNEARAPAATSRNEARALAATSWTEARATPKRASQAARAPATAASRTVARAAPTLATAPRQQ